MIFLAYFNIFIYSHGIVYSLFRRFFNINKDAYFFHYYIKRDLNLNYIGHTLHYIS